MFESTKFDVEFALESVVNVDERFDVRPCQFSPQCGENCFVRKCLCNAETMPQLLFAPAPTVECRELTCQLENDLLTVLPALPVQNIGTDAPAYLPIKKCEFSVDALAARRRAPSMSCRTSASSAGAGSAAASVPMWA